VVKKQIEEKLSKGFWRKGVIRLVASKPIGVNMSEKDLYTNNGIYKKDVDPEVTCWHCGKTFLCDCMDATCRLCGAPYSKERCKEFNFTPHIESETKMSKSKTEEPVMVWEVRNKTTSLLFNRKELADKFISQFPGSVSFDVNMRPVHTQLGKE